MSDRMSRKELDRLMEKIFSFKQKDISFFRKTLLELTKTEEGSRLLHSLSANFTGQKLTLKTHSKLDTYGYFSDDEFSIGVGVSNPFLADFIPQLLIREAIQGYPKILFHELTHWEQYQNRADSSCAGTEEDKFFTMLKAEADAQASGDLFKMEQKSPVRFEDWLLYPGKQLLIIASNRFNPKKKTIRKIQQELRKNHSDWSEKEIKQESKKIFFKKLILKKDSHWRRFYEKPAMIKAVVSENKNRNRSQREFPDLMVYYMKKYNLSLDECRELKKEVLSQVTQNFSSQMTHQPKKNPIQTSEKLNLTNIQRLRRASNSCHQVKNPVAVPSVKPGTKPIEQTSIVRSHFNNSGRGG